MKSGSVTVSHFIRTKLVNINVHEKVELSGITKQIMPGPSGDLEVNVTLGYSSRSPSSPGIICII